MLHNLAIRRRLVGALTGTALVGALSVGTAGAAVVDQSLTNELNLSRTVEQCVPVAVPTATATVKATLTVSAAGAKNTTRYSSTVATPNLGTVTICVTADADAQLGLNAAAVADAGAGGTTVNVGANVAAEAAVNAKVTVNGVQVL